MKSTATRRGRPHCAARTPLDALVKSTGTTVTSLAKSCGVTRQTIQFWLSGKAGKPDPVRIAAAIGIEVNEVDKAIVGNMTNEPIQLDLVEMADNMTNDYDDHQRLPEAIIPFTPAIDTNANEVDQAVVGIMTNEPIQLDLVETADNMTNDDDDNQRLQATIIPIIPAHPPVIVRVYDIGGNESYNEEIKQIAGRVVSDYQGILNGLGIDRVHITCLHDPEHAGDDGKWRGSLGRSSKPSCRCFSVNTVDLNNGKRNVCYMLAKLLFNEAPSVVEDFRSKWPDTSPNDIYMAFAEKYA